MVARAAVTNWPLPWLDPPPVRPVPSGPSGLSTPWPENPHYPRLSILTVNALTDSLWTLVRWAVPVTVAGVLAAGMVGANRLGDVVRTRVEARLAEEFPELTVHVQGASLVDGEGVVVRGVSFSDPSLPPAVRHLLRIDEVRLACSTNLTELATGPPQITAVHLRRPVVHATRRVDGSWTIEQLLTRRTPSTIIPVVIEDGGVVIDGETLEQKIALRQIDLEIQPDAEAGWVSLRGSMGAELLDHRRSGSHCDTRV